MTHPRGEAVQESALVVRGTGLAAVALGLCVLAGWVFGLQRPAGLLPGMAPMKANTAAALVAAGAALLLFLAGRRRAGIVAAAVSALVGLLTLLEYATGTDLGIDTLLVRDPSPVPDPGRSAPLTATLLLHLGAALLISAAGWRLVWVTQVLAALVAQAALVVLIGYAYRVPALHDLGGVGTTTVPTALGLLAVAVGTLFLNPRAGLMGLVTAPTTGGMVIRRQIPAIVITLIAFGWLRLAGERAGWYDTPTGTGLFVVLAALSFGVLTLRTGWMLHRADLHRRAAEGKALASAGLVRALLEHAPDAVFVTDPNGRYIDVNAAACRLLGYTREELLRMGVADVIPPEARPAYEGVRAESYAGKAHRGEWVLVRKDGSLVPAEANAVVLPDGRWQSFVRDVSDRRRAEAELRASDERFRLALASGAVTVFEQDAELRYVWVYPQDPALDPEPIGRIDAELLPAAEVEVLTRLKRRVLESGEGTRETIRVTLADGPRYYDLLIAPRRDPARRVTGVYGTALDVTALKRAEEALKEGDRRKDEFLATLAHELRNPLAPIRNVVHVLQLTGGDDPVARKARDVMERQLNHLVRLVDDLLDVSRITRGKLRLRTEPTDLATVVRNAVEVSRPLIEQSAHELTVALPPEGVPLNGDLVRLSQVFANLLNNAAKYTEPGGRVTLTAAVEGPAVVVAVRDTGVGIPPAALPRLFDIFSQVAGHQERSQGGLGIGLSLVRGLVDLHRGTVEAHSDGPGTGSTFVVRLPIMRNAEVGVRTSAGPPVRAPGPAVRVCKRVLVVDDNRDSAESLAMMLTMTGNEVRTAFDGEAGLEAAAAFRPDVAFLDIGMPRLDGHECARRIRSESWGGGVLLVAMTGWGQEEDRRRTREAGFDHHLVKPVDPEVLRAILATPSVSN
jgi:PAS domain S-box-containing protein